MANGLSKYTQTRSAFWRYWFYFKTPLWMQHRSPLFQNKPRPGPIADLPLLGSTRPSTLILFGLNWYFCTSFQFLFVYSTFGSHQTNNLYQGSMVEGARLAADRIKWCCCVSLKWKYNYFLEHWINPSSQPVLSWNLCFKSSWIFTFKDAQSTR